MEASERKPHCDREDDRGGVMKEPDEVAAMLRLKELSWGVRRIARELGCSHMTVRRYVAAGGWALAKVADRPSALDGLDGWLAERLRRHRGNADVVRQDLAREHGIVVSPRTMQRACAPHRRVLEAEARATVRFETPPGHQPQVDFGELRTPVAGESGRLFLFVATLGYSRRPYVRAFRHERQSAWLDGIEGAIRHFGGVTAEVLVDNARSLVSRHDAATREVAFNGRFERDDAAALKPVAGRAPFRQLRELVRVVQSDACIELDTNRYSVPWRLIGATVTVLAGEDGIVVSHAGTEVARHEPRRGRRERAIRPEYLDGIVGAGGRPARTDATPTAELLRPLAEYERLLGGAW